MEYMLIVRAGLTETVERNMPKMKTFSNDELVQAYNRSVEIGIVGSYDQAVYLLSMRYVFLERYKKSPVLIHSKIILKLTDQIKLENQVLMYLDNHPVE